MTLPATVFQGIQIGVESTSGTAVAANKKLLATSIIPSPRVETKPFRAMGNKYASFATLNKEWAGLNIQGAPTYNEIVYLLSSLLHYAAPAQQGATAAYKWTFVSNTSASDVGKTFTIEQGDANSAWRVAGAKISGLTFNFSRNEITVSGNGVGLAFETGHTLTATPTALSPVPILPTHVKFYMEDTQAGLAGADALTNSFSMEYSLTDKFGLAWAMGQNPEAVEGEPNASGRIVVATDTAGMGLITTLRSAGTKWFRIEATGAQIASPYNHKLTIDFPAQIENVNDPTNLDNVYTVEFGLLPIHDATWGKSVNIEVITNVSAL
jgi:hypothetical protein